ncbi:hypothetical protein M2171_002569 [Bradyrhizobium japonicum USDA 38]|nr:hypothetical protein [Bradyrhizobium japonicum]MCS3893436.1 hypothetical protein [Bradyrhizobium japonicum USDA 38]MCS3945950.1 hypothetical protein [Bradyrhizobium japonicum]
MGHLLFARDEITHRSKAEIGPDQEGFGAGLTKAKIGRRLSDIQQHPKV